MPCCRRNCWNCCGSDQVGGTTATSAGTVWVPGSSQSHRVGVPDTTERARRYLDSAIGHDADSHLRSLRETFLETGARTIDYLEQKTDVAFVAAAAHPDYLSNYPGAAHGGRALNALPFDGRLLGKDFARIRPARPELMVLGGMMVAKADIPALLKPFASRANFLHVARLLLRHGCDLLRYRRGTRLVMGNALVGHLFASLRKRSTPILFATRLVELLLEDGCVIGIWRPRDHSRQQGCRSRNRRRGLEPPTAAALVSAAGSGLFPRTRYQHG
jgi:3-oxosteroid 1-dehydrogenase